MSILASLMGWLAIGLLLTLGADIVKCSTVV